MDDGLIQMLVIGLFIVISMMEGITRKKRQKGQVTEQPADGESDFLRSLTGDEGAESETAEGHVPDEIWAEIADLARGGTPPTPEPVPDPEPMPGMDAALTRVAPPIPQDGDRFEELPLPVSLVSTDSLEEEREEAREAVASATFHRRHSSHLADLEKDQHYAATVGGPSAMLRLFGERGGRVDELRRAVILSEILGPPISLREPREP